MLIYNRIQLCFLSVEMPVQVTRDLLYSDLRRN